MTDSSGFDGAGVWKMLDEMAISDPVGYQKFVSEQLSKGKSVFSKPRCRGVLKCTLKEGRPLFVNICGWEMINSPKTVEDPVTFYCGSVYVVDAEKVVAIAMHPSVFHQYVYPKPNPEEGGLRPSVDELLALIALYLHKEMHILTREGDEISRSSNLSDPIIEWSDKPYGGDAMMFESLNYRKFTLADFSFSPLSEMKVSENKEIQQFINMSNPKNNHRGSLIEEIELEPYWQLVQQSKPNTYEYAIQLPRGTRIDDCCLDISRNTLCLKIKNHGPPDGFCVHFASPVNPRAAKARLGKSTYRLSVIAPQSGFPDPL